MSQSDLPSLPGSEPKQPIPSPDPTQTEAESESPNPKQQQKADTFSISDIDAIETADNDADESAALEGEALPARLSSDDFYGVFKMMFAMPNMLPVPPFPINALPIKDAEQEAARAASDAIYDIACDTPYLSWLIEPGSEWMQRLMVIGAFSFGKLMAIKMELDARIPKAPPEGDPANDNPPKGKTDERPRGDAATVVNIK